MPLFQGTLFAELGSLCPIIVLRPARKVIKQDSKSVTSVIDTAFSGVRSLSAAGAASANGIAAGPLW